MKASAGESAQARLCLVQNRAGQPARTDDAIGPFAKFNQFVQRMGRRCTVGIDVADPIRGVACLQSFDERATFANRIGKVQRADEWKIRGHAIYDREGIIATPVQDHDQFKLALILFLKIFGILKQDRSDPRLFVVSRDQQQQAGLAVRAHKVGAAAEQSSAQ